MGNPIPCFIFHEHYQVWFGCPKKMAPSSRSHIWPFSYLLLRPIQSSTILTECYIGWFSLQLNNLQWLGKPFAVKDPVNRKLCSKLWLVGRWEMTVCLGVHALQQKAVGLRAACGRSWDCVSKSGWRLTIWETRPTFCDANGWPRKTNTVYYAGHQERASSLPVIFICKSKGTVLLWLFIVTGCVSGLICQIIL